MRTCPNCGTGLETINFAGTAIDKCPKCAGIWFDASELKRVKDGDPTGWKEIEDQIAPLPDKPITPDPAWKACPACRQPMYHYRFMLNSDIMLDQCTACDGIWVDDGELGRMQQFLDECAKKDQKLPAEAIAMAGELEARAQMNRERAQSIMAFNHIFMTRLPFMGYFGP